MSNELNTSIHIDIKSGVKSIFRSYGYRDLDLNERFERN